ncbi:MAG TPA: nuclear transport factor 2 family protein [Thermoleophilaceae bacterium]|nr:nuclear transport factor 2 family protein [Thermoleophilaceae bacterium]
MSRSSSTVELVRRIYDAAERRDDVTPFQLYSEDIVWDLSGTRVAAFYPRPVFHGHEGVRDAWREGVAVFRDVHMALQDLIAVDEDRVLAEVREQHLGRTSGVAVEATHYALWTLADGKVVRMQTFEDRSEAEEAAREQR